MDFYKILVVLVTMLGVSHQFLWPKGKAKVDKTNVLLPPRIFYVSEPVYIPMPIPQVPALQLMTPVSPDVALPQQYPSYDATPDGNDYAPPASGNNYAAANYAQPAAGNGYGAVAANNYALPAAGNGYALPAANNYASLPAYGAPLQNYAGAGLV